MVRTKRLIPWLIVLLSLTMGALYLYIGRPSAPPNILVISIDTLRRDKLGVYGNKRLNTTNMDSIAKGGVVLESFYTHAPWTRASFASLFTSLYPHQHRAERNMQSGYNHPLDDKITMAEILEENGYETVAVQGNGNAGAHYGFGRGFSLWMGPELIDKSTGLPYPPAEITYQAFSDWFGKRTDKPFFAWVNFVDPHTPYAPPEEFAMGIVDESYHGKVRRPFANVRMGRFEELSKKDKAYIEQLYDAEVLHADRYVGRLLTLLKDKGLYNRTIIILTADHGEEFWEHGRSKKNVDVPYDWGFGHGHVLYDEMIRVPFIIRYPRTLWKTWKINRVSKLVRQVDILPTVLDMAGIDAPEDARFEGRSVLPLLRGKTKNYAEPDVFTESMLYGTEKKSIRTSRYKLIRHMKTGMIELYDMLEDPKEKDDISKAKPKVARVLSGKLDRWIREGR